MTTIVKRGGRKLYQTLVPQTGEVAYYSDYKEPLVQLDRGYGYEGVLLQDEVQQKVQCHFCGEWHKHLGPHIRKHGFANAKAYKDEYGLLQRSALVGDRTRVALIRNGKNQIKKLSRESNLRGVQNARLANKPRIHTSRQAAEFKNKKGICTLQLLTWLRTHPDATRNKTDERYAQAIIRAFGSWSRGRELAGLTVRNPQYFDEFNPSIALEGIRTFVATYHRAPSRSDARRGLLPYTDGRYTHYFGAWSKALQVAGVEPYKMHNEGSSPLEAHMAAIIDMYVVQKQTMKQIGQRFGVTPTTIGWHLHKHGIPTRRMLRTSPHVA